MKVFFSKERNKIKLDDTTFFSIIHSIKYMFYIFFYLLESKESIFPEFDHVTNPQGEHKGTI